MGIEFLDDSMPISKKASDNKRVNGGAEGNRTPDLDIANVALSQLSSGLQADTRGPNTNGRFGSPSQVRDRAEDVGCRK